MRVDQLGSSGDMLARNQLVLIGCSRDLHAQVAVPPHPLERHVGAQLQWLRGKRSTTPEQHGFGLGTPDHVMIMGPLLADIKLLLELVLHLCP